MEETINYIINRIYFQKEIEPLCKKFIFKKLLLKLTKGCVFPANRKLLKQVDGCAMGGPISVVFSDIYMCKMEFDDVVPAKPLFYKRYVDDTYVLRKKSIRRMLFKDLNSYHQNIKLTVEVNPSKFLDTELIREKRSILTQVFTKLHKFPVHWSSKIPIRYKRNALIGHLHTAKQIASNFDKEIRRIREKYRNAGFPSNIVNETILNFKKEIEETIISEWLFEERKIFTVRLPYSSANKKFSKLFVNKIENYINGKVKLVIILNTRKIQSLFNHKDKIQNHSCVIYRGVCSCGADCIGGTIRNSKIRWKEHSTGKDKNSDCVKHLNDNFDQKFRWFVLSRALKNFLKWEILEAYYIKTRRQPSLNTQVNSDILNLYRNGVT